MQINEAQKTIQELFKNISHPRLASFIALTEEVGELANEIMKKEIYEENKDHEKIQDELADVLVCLFELANLYNIDIEKQFKKKISDLQPRIKQWQTAKDLLRRKRDKLD